MFVRYATSPRRAGSSNFQLFGSSQFYFIEVHSNYSLSLLSTAVRNATRTITYTC